jgi:hypothetical protein
MTIDIAAIGLSLGLRFQKDNEMSAVHKEIHFEDEICDCLIAHGWLYCEGDAKDYDRTRALFPADVTAWVQATQSKAWEALQEPWRANSRNLAGTAARFA